MEALTFNELEAGFGYPGYQVDYLCNIGARHSFLYFETPKVACSSIKRTLQLLEGANLQDAGSNVHDKSQSTLKGALSLGWTFEQIFFSSRLFRFTFVRNPYARALSCYLEKIVADEGERGRHQAWLGFFQAQPVSFLQFLQAVDRIADRDRDIHWRSQAMLINDQHIQYNYIGRFESLQRDFPQVLDHLGIDREKAPLLDISHHKTNASARLQEIYGPDEEALARKIYHSDFLRFGYSFEIPG